MGESLILFSLNILYFQLCIIFAAFRVSRMSAAATREQLLADILSESPRCKASDVMNMDFNSNTKMDFNSNTKQVDDMQIESDTLPMQRPSYSTNYADISEIQEVEPVPKKVTPRPSTSPAKLPNSAETSRRVSAYVHCLDYETIQE